jgi:hypothetical protein
MGKYHSKVKKVGPQLPEGPHPIWKSLGCLMMIIVPVMSIAAAGITLQYALDSRWPIPPVMLRPITFPQLLYRVPALAWLLVQITSVRYLVGYIVLSVIFIVVLGGIVSILYAILYRVAGPPKYGPLDAPPVSRRAKPYKR